MVLDLEYGSKVELTMRRAHKPKGVFIAITLAERNSLPEVSMTNCDSRAAFHAAGHAVIAHLLKIDLPRIGISDHAYPGAWMTDWLADDDTELGVGEKARTPSFAFDPMALGVLLDDWRLYCVCAAGVAAELKYLEKVPPTGEEPDKAAHRDWAMLTEAIKRRTRTLCNADSFHTRMLMYRHVDACLRIHWPLVQALASMLPAIGSLSACLLELWFAKQDALGSTGTYELKPQGDRGAIALNGPGFVSCKASGSAWRCGFQESPAQSRTAVSLPPAGVAGALKRLNSQAGKRCVDHKLSPTGYPGASRFIQPPHARLDGRLSPSDIGEVE
ncbi:MAG: hypothetical protein K8T91_16155 [Planctomycetes bacterium]|nr:hypothetical protein [Planctomycetota bacterium]